MQIKLTVGKCNVSITSNETKDTRIIIKKSSILSREGR